MNKVFRKFNIVKVDIFELISLKTDSPLNLVLKDMHNMLYIQTLFIFFFEKCTLDGLRI